MATMLFNHLYGVAELSDFELLQMGMSVGVKVGGCVFGLYDLCLSIVEDGHKINLKILVKFACKCQ